MLLLIPLPQNRCSWCLNLGVVAAKAEGVFVVCPPPPHPCEQHNWHYQLLFHLAWDKNTLNRRTSSLDRNTYRSQNLWEYSAVSFSV